MASVLHPDPFNVTLLESPSLAVTLEQQNVIKKVLELACSDSRFAQKAYDAIWRTLTVGVVKIPSVTGLSPRSVAIGQPSFDIHITGTNFNSASVILFNGYEEPTTFVSATEVTTGVNMDVWQAAATVPIMVKNDDIVSNAAMFTFTAAPPQADEGSVLAKAVVADKLVETPKEKFLESKKAAEVLDRKK